MSASSSSPKRVLLGDPRLRRELMAMVRRRVPADEVDDVVQATLTEALASTTSPESVEELRRWIWGIARHKVADLHRKQRRESPSESIEAVAPPEEGREADDLLRWAERELPANHDARKTLDWLLREGEGEKLEHIAAAENLPAPRVRQRVTRLRQHFRARWQMQLVAVATLVGAGLLVWWLRPRPTPTAIGPDPVASTIASADPTPAVRGAELRVIALAACERGENEACLRGLDEAAVLDPAGDQSPAVQAARQAAAPRPPVAIDSAHAQRSTPRASASSSTPPVIAPPKNPAPPSTVTPKPSPTSAWEGKPSERESTGSIGKPVKKSNYKSDAKNRGWDSEASK